MSEKVYLLILKVGIYTGLLSVFLVFKNLLFPFITSKQISFNILVEILFVLWVAFIVKFPSYRPKWSYISFALLAFVFALTISSIFGIDFNLSFWGDVERMLGVFHVLHFVIFYLIIITVLRDWNDWKIFFIASVSVAAVVSIMGLGQGVEAYSSIGNTAYVSAYLIFNIYFSFILFFKEKNTGLRWLYLLPLPLLLLEFKNADTTGAYVGLGLSIIVLFFLYGVLVKNKKIKFATLALFLFLAITSTLLLINKNSDFVTKNSLLQPISGIDFKKDTFQTRLISWRAAWKDFRTHPVFGTGFGNYAVIFDKYFDASFYNYTRSETYFDRAHNNVIDIASTSGIIGMVTYLSIFVAALYYLIVGYRKDYFDIHEFVLIVSLLVAYFVQNLAVFDSLVTYVGLMMILAFIYYLYEKGEAGIGERIEAKTGQVARRIIGKEELQNKEIYTLLFVGAISFIIMWQYNIQPFKMLAKTIEGQRAWASGNAQATIDIYKEALSYNTVLDRDSRTSLIRLFADPGAFNSFVPEQRLAVADFLIELAQINVDYNKSDSLNQMMLAQILDAASKVAGDDKQKAMNYSDRAMIAINDSIKASPGRAPVYYQKAQIELTRGEQDNAIATLLEAYKLNEIYFDSSCHLGKILLFAGKKDEGYTYIDKCIDLNGSQLLMPLGQIKSFVAHYTELGDKKRVIKLYEYLHAAEPNDTSIMIELAKQYANAGMTTEAIDMAKKVAEKNPSVQNYVNEFIDKLK